MDNRSQRNAFAAPLANLANDDDYFRVVNEFSALHLFVPPTVSAEVTPLLLCQPFLVGSPLANSLALPLSDRRHDANEQCGDGVLC